MLFAGIVAATLMGAGCALLAADTRVARRATYTFYRWRRHRARLPALATRRTGITRLVRWR
jgi:hypothetical protein